MFQTNQRRRSRARSRSRSRNRAFRREQQLKEFKQSVIIEEIVDDLITPKMAQCVMEELVEQEPKISFSCQLAHGSETIKLENMSSVTELFGRIAEGFKIRPEEIIFCTINTPRSDMKQLFSGSIENNDMLFAHLRGQPVEVELVKTELTLGVTIADNGLCRSFLKRVREGSVAAQAGNALIPGQLIESIQGQSVLGLRHFEVARVIRGIPIGQSFVMRLVSPLVSGFSFIQPRNKTGKQTTGNGMGTIRFKADGGLVVQMNGPDKSMIEKMNELFRNYLGVEDDELAQTIWDTAVSCKTLQEMINKVRNSELQMFNFPDELVFDMWGIVSDLQREARKSN